MEIKRKRGRPRLSDEEKTKRLIEKEKNKKKRGRKAKKKDLNFIEPLKRGRKKKINDINDKNDNGVERIKKKRGRKPKYKGKIVYGAIIQNTAKINQDKDNILIHLPINSSDLNNQFVEKKLLKYDPIINTPLEDTPSSMGGIPSDCISWLDQKKGNNNIISSFLLDKKKIENKLIIKREIKKELKENEIIKEDLNYIHKFNWYDEKNENLENLENFENFENFHEVSNEIKKNRNKNLERKCKYKKKINSTMKQFKYYNNLKKWPKNTSIWCFWDNHSFNSVPCAIPTKYLDGVYHLDGCFCSPECAAAYIFYGDETEEYIKYERYSLLNLLYKNALRNNELKIKLASQRRVLNIYGGNLDINEFRALNSNYKKTYNIIMPPFISIIPQQEEQQLNNKYLIRKNKPFIPIDKEKLKEASNSLRLKRNMQITKNINTLESCMNLTYA